VSGWP